ncbi:ABC transporter ATP-binding protein [Tunicatimonas pelagia]|uniref:ABC transporter ATP-binding protein n=1 Tax=Tunicatimonas pelagia TaxID=931531 RepID=UPI0026661128|nr:ABC transporter ATP-binding protein [Tunicatimonas pelagia]WKN41784.1 ABC transporter ATP-binding protein [Tunicatimonas pelagia]
MRDAAISAQNISKRYRIGLRERADTLAGRIKQTLAYPIRNLRNIAKLNSFDESDSDRSIFWALRDIDFSVKPGDVLGIIGHNGAGKSTLLKILSRITEPTTGEIEIRGRVSSLLEVGTGFHEELTGHDNVYMNGTILGMTKWEIDSKMEQIVDFAGVEQYIHTPVKFYSSGMRVRLAFSVAAHLDPEILIIDEVLAVGDLGFQQKCLGKMDEVSRSGRTILFVSHNMGAVEGLCTRAMLLDKGRIAYDGGVTEAIDLYRDATLSKADEQELAQRTDRDGVGNFKFTHVVLNGGDVVLTDRPLKIDLYYQVKETLQNLQLVIKISRNYREIVMTIDSKAQGVIIDVEKGEGMISVKVPNLPLLPYQYVIDLWSGISGGVEDRIFNAAKMLVEERDIYGTGNIPNAKKHGLLVAPKCEWVAQEISVNS